MKFLFLVQGEGRGHMTQAISFSRLLDSAGHELAGVVVGKSTRRILPEFFSRQIKAPIYLVDSPNFETDPDQKKISIRKTILTNCLKLNTFRKSLLTLNHIVKQEQPDVILNFYDLLGGFYNFLFQPNANFWVIGHQYLIEHPDFKFAPGRSWERFLFKLNTDLTALGAKEKLALSFLPQAAYPGQRIRVVPPLLRPEVKMLKPIPGDFYLAYMVNPGYSQEVIFYANANPQLRIKAYWDKKDALETENPLPNLSFHRIHDKNFLQDMASCKGLVCTAGFESVCEAMYLGKPAMVIPVAGQYEQACNALDASASGAAIPAKEFDFEQLEKFYDQFSPKSQEAFQWTESWESLLDSLICNSSSQASPLEIPYPSN